MSNPFPPRSSIGGAYSGYNYADAGLRHGGLQTLSRAELPPAHSGAGYSTTISPHPSSALNNHNFMANATGSNTTAHAGSPQIPPPPFHVSSDLFKHFASSSLPPPPYPPVPIPHLGFPQFPPPPPHFAATSTPPNNFLMGSSLSQQSNPLPLHIPPAPPEYHQNTLTIAREEGELSDGELDASSAKSVIVPTQPGSKAQSRLSAKPAEIAFSNQEEYSARTFSKNSTHQQQRLTGVLSRNPTNDLCPTFDAGCFGKCCQTSLGRVKSCALRFQYNGQRVSASDRSRGQPRAICGW